MRELDTTGKAVLVGGTGLIIALGLVAIIGPMELMVSVGTAALTCAMFATGGAVVVMPAALVLFGRHINAFSFPAPRFLQNIWSGLLSGGNWVTRHALYAGFAATALLAALAVPALSLKSGQESVKQLPKNAQARIAFEEVSHVMGAGWATPFTLVVVSNNRPITTPALLASIDKFQRQIAKDKRVVASVAGPGSIKSTSKQLKAFGPGLKKSVKLSNKSKKDLLKLIDGLGQAGAGSNQLRAGLNAAVSGANQLNGGAGQAAAGSGALRSGLLQASGGSVQLENGLNQALSGANQLKDGAAQALAGATTLGANINASAGGIPDITGQIGSTKSAVGATSSAVASAKSQAGSAAGAIQSAIGAVSKSDPNYSSIVASLNQASAQVGSLIGLTQHRRRQRLEGLPGRQRRRLLGLWPRPGIQGTA